MDLEGCDHSCMQVVSLQQHTTRSAMQSQHSKCAHSCMDKKRVCRTLTE